MCNSDYSLEQAGGKSGPRLIAPICTKNPTVELSTGALYSIDMMRLRVSVAPCMRDDVIERLDTWMLSDKVETYTSNRIGTYRYMWSFGFGHTSVKAGYMLVAGSGRVDETEGFVEYNPNKLDEEGMALVRRLQGVGAYLEPVRYDLAIDYALKRDELRVMKDARKYECQVSNGMTEYLGQRSKPGRVKVYDKAAELGLDCDLTRVELTCDARWDVRQVMDKLPVIYSCNAVEWCRLRGVTRAFAAALMSLAEGGAAVEPWLRMVDPKTRSKIREVMRESVAFEYSDDCVSHLMERVRCWCS